MSTKLHSKLQQLRVSSIIIISFQYIYTLKAAEAVHSSLYAERKTLTDDDIHAPARDYHNLIVFWLMAVEEEEEKGGHGCLGDS